VDATYLANKLVVAQAFSDALTTDSAANLAYTGATATTAARALITGVTTSAATTNVASTISTIKTGGGGSTAGQTFTLTTDDDTFTGTAGNDTFTATSATLSSDDRILDTSTTDSDVMNITAAADLTLTSAMDVTNVETINVSWNSFSTPDIDLTDVSGATVVITSTRSGYLGNVNFTDVGENNIKTGAGIIGTLAIDGIEDATVTSTLADEIDIGATTPADGEITVVADAANTVTIVGGDDIILTALVADDIALSAGFDTAVLNLGVDADVTVDGADDSVVTINSDEDITVTIEAASEYEELTVGGTGTVTLVIDAVADLAGLTITNTDGDVELDVALATADFSSVSAKNIIFTTEAAGGDILTIASGQSFVFEDEEGTAGDSITFQTTTDDDSAADSVTITLEDEQAQDLIFDIADREVETVNIVIDANADFDDETDFTIADLLGNSDAGTVFVITSSDADIEVLVTAADASVIDASGVLGEFTLTSQTTNEELTIMGAVGDTTVAFAGTDEDSTYVGQDGDDTVVFDTTTGTATALLGDGDNTVEALAAINGAGTLAVITGSGDNTITANALTTGSLTVISGEGDDVVSATGVTSGSVSLDLGAGDNEITLGAALLAAAEISITTGAGDDTITMDGAAVAADINIALGTGTNRLILADNANLTDYTLTITGLSEIELDAGDVGAVIDSELLDGTSIEILSSGVVAGALVALLGVELADDTTSFDGSSLTISDSNANGALGLIVTVVTAADDFTIVASEGADTITTGTGDDTITGGAGADTITTGTGDDIVVIGSRAATKGGSYAGTNLTVEFDAITDFVAADDVIQLSSTAAAFGTGITLSADTVFEVTALTDVNDFVSLTALFAGIEAAAGADGVASTSALVQVYDVTLTADADVTHFDGGIAKRLLIINDGTADLAVADMIIDITGITGALTSDNFTIA
jgi:hypothetical protein